MALSVQYLEVDPIKIAAHEACWLLPRGVEAAEVGAYEMHLWGSKDLPHFRDPPHFAAPRVLHDEWDPTFHGGFDKSQRGLKALVAHVYLCRVPL